ncbi:hypothetical protein ABE28_019815 [Peribacillus muralis]|uniref:Uncharacterized protein n=1 Tax=Peribacillus muralis TaxID=264697 RepID=A0A1B3XTS8_9BACI|nr:hypothetical protein [Peribacillus muralis]AOH56620.1 hypothetical protein ABE28_019815 [Peribacillus muralis]
MLESIRVFLCFLSLFLLSGLVLASMESIFLTDIFGRAAKSVPILYGLALIYLIRDYFKEIKEPDFVMMVFLSIASYMGLVVIFVE